MSLEQRIALLLNTELRKSIGVYADQVSCLGMATAVIAVMPDNEQWQTIDKAPKDEMFVWAYRHKDKWRLGLAYWTVIAGQWRDAYGGNAHMHATHCKRIGEPPA